MDAFGTESTAMNRATEVIHHHSMMRRKPFYNAILVCEIKTVGKGREYKVGDRDWEGGRDKNVDSIEREREREHQEREGLQNEANVTAETTGDRSSQPR